MKKTIGLSIILSLCFTLLTGFAPALHAPEDPVSTTGSLYGYQGEIQDDVLSDATFEQVNGKYEVSGIQRLVTDGSAARTLGNSSLALAGSYLRSETETAAAPAADRFDKLLVSGSLSAAQGLGTSQSYFINSSLIARNGAAALLDKAVKPEADAQPLSMYLYGSEAITADGGFGANSDIFSSLCVYGSHIQAAEVGLLAGTDSRVTIGTIQDGENDSALSGKLEASEKARWTDKSTGSVIEGGRNALVIYSESLPEYWGYAGYSKDELLSKSAILYIKGATLRTDESLDKGISYGEAANGYINHTKGSLVLIKSSNAAITFEECDLIAGKDGAGNLIQTVISNDIENMTAVPDGGSSPGVNISMKYMNVKGNISHEDYQRNLGLTLLNTTYSGAVNAYDAAHWNGAAVQEGFKDYCPDETYGTRHIAAVAVIEGSSWTITAESHLGWLYIDDTSKITGKIIVDGVEQANIQGSTYFGDIIIVPGSTSSAPAIHDHNWLRADGGYPADCENNGMIPYYCSICGAPYTEVLPALGHDWQLSYQYGPFCEAEGYADYICARCGAPTEVALPATGHNWLRADGGYPADCTYDGMIPYYCSVCGATYNEIIPTTGHTWYRYGGSPPDCIHDGAKCYVCTTCGATYDEILPALAPSEGHDYFLIGPTEYEPSGSHTYKCLRCGSTYTEPHTTGTPGGCAICGYSEPFG